MNQLDGKTRQPLPTDPGCCQFYLQQKRRYCKFPPANDEKFCIQHFPRDEAGLFEFKGKKRIPCPLDPNHSIYEGKLTSHVKKCNSKPKNLGAFHKQDINSGEMSDTAEPTGIILPEIDVDNLKLLVNKISKIYKEYIDVKERIEEHELLKEDLSNPEHQKSLKHRKQEASLLGNMERSGWLTDNTAYIEFGAGRGRLTSYLFERISTQSNSKVLLVDRDTTRTKCENRYKFLENGPSLERLRIDIKDLALDEHEISTSEDRKVVGYSKHLCGSATDLTLRCIERITNTENKPAKESESKRPKLTHTKVKGIQIALCCHHRCQWIPYVGKDFWTTHGLTADDFIVVRTVSSWATCAFPDKPEETETSHDVNAIEENVVSRFSCWTSDERKLIGLKCKRVIDIGREHYLHRLGYKTQLIEYVKEDVSLENVMLTASPLETRE